MPPTTTTHSPTATGTPGTATADRVHEARTMPMSPMSPMSHMSYGRFAAMVATATVVMYCLMFSTALEFRHVWFSQTRLWMALYMGAMMAVIMLAFMRAMYPDRRTNAAVFVGSAVVFAGALALARSQATVGDVAWMQAMIPHHSIAILTSERAHLTDPRVRALAARIAADQRREIAEMEVLIADLERAR